MAARGGAIPSIRAGRHLIYRPRAQANEPAGDAAEMAYLTGFQDRLACRP
jgi:hypothetical protein